MKVYGDSNSGNCLKVKWVCDKLAVPYQWVEVDTSKGETRTPQFLAMNGAGQVPTVAFDDGRTLAQSNAIIRYLARDSVRPSSKATVGTWPAPFMARNCGVRVSPLLVSTSTH